MLTLTGADRREEGFSFVEMVIVLLLASLVLAVAAGALISLDNAAGRNDSVVQEEQAASTVMAQMERDIRSASGISVPAGATAADELEVAVLGADGSTTDILWRYDPAAQTLTRQSQQNGTFQPSGYSIARVVNGTGSPVFRYFDRSSSDISTTTTSNITACATAVGVDVEVASGTAGVGPYEETAEVALTDQAQALSTPGDGQCGSA